MSCTGKKHKCAPIGRACIVCGERVWSCNGGILHAGRIRSIHWGKCAETWKAAEDALIAEFASGGSGTLFVPVVWR